MSTVQGNDGTQIPLGSCITSIAYDGTFVSTITVNYQDKVFVQTFTNDGTNITGFSNWVLQ